MEDRLRSIAGAGLEEDRAHMVPDGFVTDSELDRDLFVGAPHRDQSQNRDLAV